MSKKKTNQPKQPSRTETSRRRSGGIKRSYGDAVERPTIKPPSFDPKPKE